MTWSVRRAPRLVAWGGRVDDIQIGSAFDNARCVWLAEIARVQADTARMFGRVRL